jgi:hypothetical protein
MSAQRNPNILVAGIWVYQSFEVGLFTVGFYDPNGTWHPEGDYEKREDAAKRVHYLNGGDGPSSGA